MNAVMNGAALVVPVILGLGGMFLVILYGIGKYRKVIDEERTDLIDVLRIRLDENAKLHAEQLEALKVDHQRQTDELKQELELVKCEVVALRSSTVDDTAAKVADRLAVLWSPETFASAFAKILTEKGL